MSKFWILMLALAITCLALTTSAGAQSQICPDVETACNQVTATAIPTCEPSNTGCYTVNRNTVVVPTTGIALPASTVNVAVTPNTTTICAGVCPTPPPPTNTPVHELSRPTTK